MFALPISMPCFISIVFYQNSPKIELFLQKTAKFLSAGFSTSKPLCLQQLGTHPHPQWPTTAGGSLPDPQDSPPL